MVRTPLVFFLFLTLAYACSARKDKAPALQTSFTGYNRFGEARQCFKTDNTSCGNVSAEADPFRNSCLAQSGEIFQCDCESFLCSVQIKK